MIDNVLNATQLESPHCSKDALTDFFGWMLQGLLAGLAFTCLIGKRFCEPRYVRRSWETWWYDTSKQGIGALVIHMTNVYTAPLYQGDPCTWYVINFLLDSTIGLLIIFIGIRLCHYLAKRKKWPAINFGEYDAPKSWVYQTWIYIGLMAIVKLFTTLFIQLEFWDSVKDLVMSPFSNAKVEQAIIMLIIPFFVNMLMFWVTDNFLMNHNRQSKVIVSNISNGKALNGFTCRIKYQNSRNRNAENDSESDALISGDEDTDVEILKRDRNSSISSFDETSSSRRPQKSRFIIDP